MKLFLIPILLLLVAPVWAKTPVVEIIIRDHLFHPAEVKVPANTKIKLVIINEDTTSEEFESHTLNREKVIPGNSKSYIYIGPLSPGEYEFEGEFNLSTAKGIVVAE